MPHTIPGLKVVILRGGNNTEGREWPTTKYYDTYHYRTSYSDFTRYIYGDATGELGSFANRTYGSVMRQISSWYDDSAFFVRAADPWFRRGGDLTNGNESGVFAFSPGSGSLFTFYSFRVVLAN